MKRATGFGAVAVDGKDISGVTVRGPYGHVSSVVYSYDPVNSNPSSTIVASVPGLTRSVTTVP